MGSDFTDGGGWAKLDKTSADRLAELCIKETPRRIRMLMQLFASIDGDGTTTIGSDVLAKRCGVGDSTAADYIASLVDDGTLIVDGERKTKSGVYTVRHFWWIEPTAVRVGDFSEGVSGPDRTPVSGNRGENRTPVSGKGGGNRTHQRSQTSTEGRSGRPSPDPGPAKGPTRSGDQRSKQSWTQPPPDRPHGEERPKRPNETALNPDLMKPPPPYWDEDNEECWLTPPSLDGVEY